MDGIVIAENNACWWRQDRDYDQIELLCNTTTKTTTTTTKGVGDHDKEFSPKGGKYPRRAKARRRDWCLPRRYVALLSGLMTTMWHSCSWQRQPSRLQPHCRQQLHRGCHCCWEQGQQLSSQDCHCRDNAPDNANDNELDQELVGIR